MLDLHPFGNDLHIGYLDGNELPIAILKHAISTGQYGVPNDSFYARIIRIELRHIAYLCGTPKSS